jgi:cytochrome c5
MQSHRKLESQTHTFPVARLLASAMALALATALLSPAVSAELRERTGKEVVDKTCASCHEKGVNGAPKIGDREAWIPRMSNGLDTLVRSAVHGHGAMPARGGMADLSDREIESAIVHMFNYGVVTAQTRPGAAPTAGDPFQKVIGGTEVHLGVVQTDTIPAAQRPAGTPSGKGYYHVNISLIDVASKVAIKGAHVKVRVADSLSEQTKTLETITANDSISYGGYFRMASKGTYTITALIQRPDAGAIEAKFAYVAR